MKKITFLSLICIFCFTSCKKHVDVKQKDGFILVQNEQGPTLGCSGRSGVTILQVDGSNFKDLNKNGKLDKYEDWRLSVDERAEDLASQMSIEQIAGLMLYSAHQAIPSQSSGFYAGHYNGQAFDPTGMNAWDLTDEQKAFLENDNLRHVLITSVESPEIAARWNNNMQAFVEGSGLGIPGNTSSDPRHSWQSGGTAEFNVGGGSDISVWPDGLAMAATFDPGIVRQFGEVAAQEYRAMGITTALSPQIDLGTEPRWYRIGMSFGEDPKLVTDMAKAYIDGMQTSTGNDEIAHGWGYKSVNAMVKHWPGGGPEEGGRDAHWAYGKFAVYPGRNLDIHIKPFSEGAFNLDGRTKTAAAVMPYYTISYDQDKKDGENVGNGFSEYFISDLLRNKYKYDGVVCTDWLITANEAPTPDGFAGKPWGVESLSVEQRHYKVLMAGVDQFGGNNDIKPVLAAYRMGVEEHGEEFMRKRFERSAVRLLKNMFRIGLFENPYLDPSESAATVGNPDFMKMGYDAQVRSIVLLKNKKSVLPIDRSKTVYIPELYFPAEEDWFGNITPAKTANPVPLDLIRAYYNVTDDPEKADVAIVFIKSPTNPGGGYSREDRKNGGNGYIPITLQYGPYKAVYARTKSIAAGDPVIDPDVTDRSYKDKTVTAGNISDLTAVTDTRKAMKDKPVIVVVNAAGPMIFNEFERSVDGLLVRFGVSDRAVMDILSGVAEPSGLLPVQMPADMRTVEQQLEDIPFDMRCYVDSEGHTYDFAFGLNLKGIIRDDRTVKYGR